jgi:hypothetical protein
MAYSPSLWLMKLGKKPVTKPKNARKIKGTGLGT